MKKAPKILYFIRGSLPTKEEQEAAEELGANIAYRNVEFIGDEAPEAADGVAGGVYVEKNEKGEVVEETSLIPHRYANYPKAAEVMAAYKAGKELPKAKPTEATAPAAAWKAGA